MNAILPFLLWTLLNPKRRFFNSVSAPARQLHPLMQTLDRAHSLPCCATRHTCVQYLWTCRRHTCVTEQARAETAAHAVIHRGAKLLVCQKTKKQKKEIFFYQLPSENCLSVTCHLRFLTLGGIKLVIHQQSACWYRRITCLFTYRVRIRVRVRLTYKQLKAALSSSLFLSLVQRSVVCRLRGGCCWRILAASVQPPPNVMTGSIEALHTAGSSEAPAFGGVRPAPRHKPRRCAVLSLHSSHSRSLPLICLFPLPSRSACFFSSFTSLWHALSLKVLSCSVEVCFHGGVTSVNLWKWK